MALIGQGGVPCQEGILQLVQQKRDNEYLLVRMRKEHPALYAEVKAGKISINAARQKAGLGGTRTRLHELKNAWTKGTPAERLDFLSWAGLAAAVPVVSSPPSVSSGSTWNSDGTLTAWAKKRIPEIMRKRSMLPGELCDELGVSRFDQSVSMAVRNGHKVKSTDLAKAVDQWLLDNATI